MTHTPIRFTNAQRGGVVAMLAAGIVVALWQDRSWTSRIEDPSPVGHRVDQLVGRIDPNKAEATALVAIPGLGERRSRDIVAFREKNSDGNTIVYYEPKDLMQVRGIGPALSKQMEPYLTFPRKSNDESAGTIKKDQAVSIDANR